MGSASVIEVNLPETIPPIDPPKDTKYVRHLRMQSKLLSQFWGAPVFLEATVFVPCDFDSSRQHYPIAFLQSHFGGDFFLFAKLRRSLSPHSGKPWVISSIKIGVQVACPKCSLL